MYNILPRKTHSFASGASILFLILVFYYISWNTIHYAPSNHAGTGAYALQSHSPSCPKLECPPAAPTTCPELESSALASPKPCPPAPTPQCPPPPSPYDPKKVAFLVETRPLPHLPALFAHMTNIIPPEWMFKVMGSKELITFMRRSPLMTRLEHSGKLEFLDLPPQYSLSNRQTISQMFTDLHLYKDILAPAEHLLVFQPDSIFCANAPRTLNEYLEWDWIGAPWSKTATYGGNGGLSLRKVSKIIQVLEKKKRTPGDGALEDLWLSREMHALPGSRSPVANVSKTFSVESVWDDHPLGYHIGWLGVHHEQIWDDQQQVDHVFDYCPEVKMILGMKLDNDKPKGIPL